MREIRRLYRLLVTAIAVVLAGSAFAQQGPVRPQPTPSSVGDLSDEGAPYDPARAEAKARQDTFNQRIADRSNKAVRSICTGCFEAGRRVGRMAPKQVEANADLMVDADDADDPFVAPPE